MIASLIGRGRPRGLIRQLDWALGHLLSFEAAFALFIYSNELKTILPFHPPIDETVIFAALSIGAGAIVIAREGIHVRGLPIIAAGLLFIGWLSLTAAWSPSQGLIFRSISYLLTFTLLSIVAGAFIIANRRERAVRFFVFVLIIATGMALYGLYIYFVYGDFRRWAGWQDVDGRVYLAFGHTIVNGAAVAFAIMLFARFGSVRQGVAGALFAICALFLLVGGGRGPFLGAVLAALLGLACRPPTVGRGRVDVPYATIAAVILLTIAAAYVAYLFSTGNMTTTLARLAKLTGEATTQNAKQALRADRLDYYAAAYQFWLAAPLFGNGLESFSYMYLNGREMQGLHPHNIFLQMLCETGLVGLVLFLVFFWLAFRHASFRRLRRDPLMVCVALFLVTSAMSALFGRDIVGVRKFFFAFSLLALRPPARAVETVAEEDELEPVRPRPAMPARAFPQIARRGA